MNYKTMQTISNDLATFRPEHLSATLQGSLLTVSSPTWDCRKLIKTALAVAQNNGHDVHIVACTKRHASLQVL